MSIANAVELVADLLFPRHLTDLVIDLREHIAAQDKRIAELETQLAAAKKNSRNSSKPPSSDITNKPTRLTAYVAHPYRDLRTADILLRQEFLKILNSSVPCNRSRQTDISTS